MQDGSVDGDGSGLGECRSGDGAHGLGASSSCKSDESDHLARMGVQSDPFHTRRSESVDVENTSTDLAFAPGVGLVEVFREHGAHERAFVPV